MQASYRRARIVETFREISTVVNEGVLDANRFVPGKPGLKVVAHDGSPAKPEHLISSVNLPVEADGEQVGDTFRLLAMKNLWSPNFAASKKDREPFPDRHRAVFFNFALPSCALLP